MPIELLRDAKRCGFSDKQIGIIFEKEESEVRTKRKKANVIPFVKQIDTLAAEFPAETNYLYLTYHAEEDDIKHGEENQIIVLGGGAYRIGSSVEFDWCCVTAVNALNKVIINRL